MFSETVELKGHILDTQVLPKILDQIIALGADYLVEDLKLGHSHTDESSARIRIDAPDSKKLAEVLELISRSGAMLSRPQNAAFEAAPADGVFPDDFYATTNLPTSVLVRGQWIHVANAEMDCGIVVERASSPVHKKKRTGGDARSTGITARGLRMNHICKGDRVVVGHDGIRVLPLQRSPESKAFGFMASAVSSEKPKQLVIRDIAAQLKRMHREKKKILFVGGPAIIHTGAGPHLQNLIEHGFVDILFAGNAIAAHDIESVMFGTSLGVSLQSGAPVEHGHEHHLRAINRIRAAGSIQAAVKKKILKSGVMYACVKKNIPFVLSGSIRDDGPLPGVITDMPQAQDAMRALLPGVGLALMVGTTLLSIATGNMLPAEVRTVCVDINPAVVTKLADRGTFQALGLVTDAELFLRSLTRELRIHETADERG